MTVAAYREASWMDHRADQRQWDHLCRAYGAELYLMFRDSALPETDCLVVVDERGETPLEDFEHPQDCTYLFGSTHMNNILDVPHAASVRIVTPNPICLFGVCAASIVLADRENKHGR